MSGTVTVLAVNGRRQTVKVSPNTTVLQIIEDVCLKQNLRPEIYNLKHHRRILDITLTVRFAGLPNNCLLELVEADVERTDQPVTVGVQTEDGTRMMAEFSPSVTIFTVLTTLCPAEVTPSTVVIYLQCEIYGEMLKSKTIKSLGITSGRAMLRLIHRDIESLKNQANVSAPLPLKSNIEQPYKRSFQSSDNSALSQDSYEPLPKVVPKFQHPRRSLIEEIRQEKQKQTEGLKIKSCVTNKTQLEEDNSRPKEDFLFLGARNAILFSFESAQVLSDEELPDEFFELSVNEIKRLFRDIKLKRMEMEESPLMTSSMRELEDSKRQLRALNQYKQAVIRIQFPNRIVLQGVFQCGETIADVAKFVREYLADKAVDFYLFTAPPKNILLPASNLLEAECVPGALLHFGCADKRENYLRSDILDKITSNSCASLAAAQVRRKNAHPSNAIEEMDVDITDDFEAHPASPTIADSYSSLPKPTRQDEKVPKWFRSTCDKK